MGCWLLGLSGVTDEPDEEDHDWDGSRAKCETQGWNIVILS